MAAHLKKIVKTLNFRPAGQISLALGDSKTIQRLNKIYRGKNQVTDVLSFSESEEPTRKIATFFPGYLGEIIICYPQAVKQAKKQQKSLKSELELLFVHGVLHLLGYDHEERGENQVMRGLEKKILG